MSLENRGVVSFLEKAFESKFAELNTGRVVQVEPPFGLPNAIFYVDASLVTIDGISRVISPRFIDNNGNILESWLLGKPYQLNFYAQAIYHPFTSDVIIASAVRPHFDSEFSEELLLEAFERSYEISQGFKDKDLRHMHTSQTRVQKLLRLSSAHS